MENETPDRKTPDETTYRLTSLISCEGKRYGRLLPSYRDPKTGEVKPMLTLYLGEPA
jgi:hypothetical protein